MFPCSTSIYLSVLLLLELSVFRETTENITETEQVFFDLKTDNGTRKNKLFQIIFPGTRWCGDGDIAEHPEDLGHFKETDACCRGHDLCSDVIYSGESKHGLTNDGFFSRVECSCDENFYKCLSSLCSPLAASIGITYFDVLRPNCFTYDYPVDCIQKEKYPAFGERCVNYVVDKSKPKVWHWREPKKFDFSETSKHLFACFEDVRAERMKITQEKLSNFIRENGVEPLIKICSQMSLNSWYQQFLCSRIVPFVEN